MSWSHFGPYVSVAERKAKALKKIKSLQAKGRMIEPLGELTHRLKIATSFWGRAWCLHLESFSDHENRLPRGRTYVRNGSVLHLGIESETVNALVQGSELYELTIRIAPLPPKTWQQIKARSQGKIGSLIELLQGKISDEIMAIVTDQNEGLFPRPKEIQFNCNCPDWASMCKHVAAVMYGVGARLDTAPELLFKLRGVDHNELIAIKDTTALSGKGGSSRRRRIDADSLSAVFGIDLDPSGDPVPIEPPLPKIRRTSKTEARPKTEAPSQSKKLPKAKKKPAVKKALPVVKPTATALCALRADLALSRTTFARRLGVSIATLAKWERAKGPLEIPKPVQNKLTRLQASGKE